MSDARNKNMKLPSVQLKRPPTGLLFAHFMSIFKFRKDQGSNWFKTILYFYFSEAVKTQQTIDWKLYEQRLFFGHSRITKMGRGNISKNYIHILKINLEHFYKDKCI